VERKTEEEDPVGEAAGEWDMDAVGERETDAVGEWEMDAVGEWEMDAVGERGMDAVGQRPVFRNAITCDSVRLEQTFPPASAA
jgi:hypothetical protein